ncbi:hypothetical protein [Streptomyces bungoensis]
MPWGPDGAPVIPPEQGADPRQEGGYPYSAESGNTDVGAVRGVWFLASR